MSIPDRDALAETIHRAIEHGDDNDWCHLDGPDDQGQTVTYCPGPDPDDVRVADAVLALLADADRAEVDELRQRLAAAEAERDAAWLQAPRGRILRAAGIEVSDQ
jgi:hypothetical protein